MVRADTDPAAAPMRDWGMLSARERNAAYDNAGAVPGSRAYMAALRVASAQVMQPIPDQAYGAGERNRWSLYPGTRPDMPCLIFIHGGYWQMNRHEDFAALVTGVQALGWSVAMPGHTLAPQASLSRIVAEVDAAIDWLSRYGGAMGISGPFLVAGWSAGATLSALALDHPSIAAGLAISGIFELGPLRDTWLNDALRLTDDEIMDLSPLRRAISPKPLGIVYGTRELSALSGDSRAFHDYRTASHAPGMLLPVPGADHFSILDGLRQPDGVLVHAATLLMSMVDGQDNAHDQDTP
ncbi:alpha/beta hydrolase [Komagataeibacter sp. FXV3]|nr:alpha/beta hydrolase [Komagataeibacter sp. FXV3]